MPFQKINGAILIIVLWFIVLITIMVATLATETRLLAKAVFYNKVELAAWNDTLWALNAAQMELLINTMPDPPGEEQEVGLSQRTNKSYRCNGRVLTKLAYPIPDTMNVRCYDHAGKINLINLYKNKILRRKLLEKLVDKDPTKVDALEDAWRDWIDLGDFKEPNGAEKDYYETLNPAYTPRNYDLETVEELLLIKGFAEIFEGVNMNAAFTIYGSHTKVNPNLATRDVLLLLPGLDEESVDAILEKRREVKEFKYKSDFDDILQPEQSAKFKQWIHFRTSKIFFSIAVQAKPSVEDEKIETEKIETEKKDDLDSSEEEAPKRAYIVTVKTRGRNQFPLILRVDPYGVLPDMGEKLPSQLSEP